MEELSKLETKIQDLEKQKQKVVNRLKQEKAKLRTQTTQLRKQRLYEIGALAEKAQLLSIDDEVLLGALLEIKILLEDEPTLKMFARKGADGS